MSHDLQKIRDHLPEIGSRLAKTLSDEGVRMLQETQTTLDEVGEIKVSIEMQYSDGSVIIFFMGLTVKTEDSD
jgi:hypothetical protein